MQLHRITSAAQGLRGIGKGRGVWHGVEVVRKLLGSARWAHGIVLLLLAVLHNIHHALEAAPAERMATIQRDRRLEEREAYGASALVGELGKHVRHDAGLDDSDEDEFIALLSKFVAPSQALVVKYS